jgi:Cytochrome C oxidase, cbb3-type, subunit III
MRTRILFVALSVVLLGLVGWAAFKDSTSRTYITIQEQYQKDYPSSDFNVQVQQLFPSFPQATIEGDTYRVERCISCHVPDIATIGPVEAAQRLSQDFFKYEPDAKQLAAEYHLTGIHPAYVTATGGNYPPSMSYAAYGPDGFTSFTYTPYTPPGATPAKPVTVEQAGPLPSFLDPSTNYGSTSGPATGELGIDQIGCIVCHNGNRLSVDEADAHQNLVINPEYDFTEGAQLYYQNCARCHGGLGEGGAGPPLNNQDRLGYYNEDYYYRCIMYGFTGFEHYGSIMPNWGGIASDYNEAANPPGPGAVVNTSPVLSQTQINVLIQFIRQWEDYTTLP